MENRIEPSFCKARTKGGTRCQRTAVAGSRYCSVHRRWFVRAVLWLWNNAVVTLIGIVASIASIIALVMIFWPHHPLLKELTVFSPMRPEMKEKIAKLAEEKLGISVKWEPEGVMSGRELGDKVENAVQERFKGDAVVVGCSYTVLEDLARKNLLRNLDGPLRDSYFKKSPYCTSFWVGWYRGFIGVAYWDSLCRFNRDSTLTWQTIVEALENNDLRVTLTDPSIGTGGQFLAFGFLKSLGPDEGKKLLDRLYHRCLCASVGRGDDIEKLVNHRVAMCINWYHLLKTDLDKSIEGQGLLKSGQIRLSIPKDTPWEIGAASILNTTDDWKTAGKFIDMLLSEQMADIQGKVMRRYSIRDSTPGLPPWPENLVLKYDVQTDFELMNQSLSKARSLWPQGIKGCKEEHE